MGGWITDSSKTEEIHLVNLPLSGHLVSLRNNSMRGALFWCLLLADGKFKVDRGQIGCVSRRTYFWAMGRLYFCHHIYSAHAPIELVLELITEKNLANIY